MSVYENSCLNNIPIKNAKLEFVSVRLQSRCTILTEKCSTTNIFLIIFQTIFVVGIF